MTRRKLVWLVGTAAIVIVGVTIASWRAPEAPYLFWAHRPGPGFGFGPGLFAAPDTPVLAGFENWTVEPSREEDVVAVPPASSWEILVTRVWPSRGAEIEQARPRALGRRFESRGARGEWVGFLRQLDALPPGAKPDLAQVGTWDEDWHAAPVTWRLGGNGVCYRSWNRTTTQGTWGVIGGVTLLQFADSTEPRFLLDAPVGGRTAWRRSEAEIGFRR